MATFRSAPLSPRTQPPVLLFLLSNPWKLWDGSHRILLLFPPCAISIPFPVPISLAFAALPLISSIPHFQEGGWVQKRLFDIGWSDESKCQACHKEKGTEKHCPEWSEIREEIPEVFRKWEQKAKTSKKRVEVAKRYRRAPLKWKQMEQGSFSA